MSARRAQLSFTPTSEVSSVGSGSVVSRYGSDLNRDWEVLSKVESKVGRDVEPEELHRAVHNFQGQRPTLMQVVRFIEANSLLDRMAEEERGACTEEGDEGLPGHTLQPDFTVTAAPSSLGFQQGPRVSAGPPAPSSPSYQRGLPLAQSSAKSVPRGLLMVPMLQLGGARSNQQVSHRPGLNPLPPPPHRRSSSSSSAPPSTLKPPSPLHSSRPKPPPSRQSTCGTCLWHAAATSTSW